MRLHWMMAGGLLAGAQLASAAPTAAPPPAAPPPAAASPPLAAPLVAPAAVTGSATAEGKAIDTAAFAPGLTGAAARDVLIRAQVILDRARYSPGVIDGRDGKNFQRALATFEANNHVAAPAADGLAPLDAAGWQALAALDPAPVTQDHVITPEEVKGPFIGKVPKDFAGMAKLKRLAYVSAAQELAETFHMDQALLEALNPGANFDAAGTRILVMRPAAGPLAPVGRVEVDKTNDEVRAYTDDGRIVATFPATVGSTDRPAPTGAFTVRYVARNPNYTYDPKRLTFGKRSQGKLTIAPGPNNPVGSTWIDLSIETYGIHGTPDPTEVGKTASHGCVRLTNWDAAALGHAVHKGTAVVFVGVEQPRA